ncbi:MAG TPA: putative lipid II flippase FtsW [Bacillota bacterium]
MKQKTPDLFILVITLILLTFGVIMVTSASAPRALTLTNGQDPFYFGKRQLIYGVFGIVLLMTTINFDYHRFRSMTGLFLILAPIFLVLVLIFGEEINGARRWINLGLFNFQPSEFAKLTLIFVLAHYLTEIGSEVKSFLIGIAVPLFFTAVISGLIMLEPDLGTTIVVFSIFLVMLFTAGARLMHLSLIGFLSLGAGIILILKEPYRLRRLITFLDPMRDPKGDGWQIMQSLIAIGSGGFFGLGLGRSRQKYFYLPEAHTDYIYAVLGEELGLIGALLILLAFFLLAWRGYKIAMAVDDPYGSMLAIGITSWLVIQALINIAVVTSTLPATGITLPLLSAGGSSLWTTLVSIGILMNISREAKDSY